MSQSREMFSESWYRVAGLKAALNPSIEVYKQQFRGERWYLLRDPLNNEFYRITPAAYQFVGRLKGDKTVEQVWQLCLQLFPDEAPGQEEVIQLLAQLHRANLFISSVPPDSSRLFERYRKARAKKFRGQLLNFLFIHIPLFDPDRLLTRLNPMGRLLFSPVGALLWLAVVGLGLKAVAENFDLALSQGRAIFAPENLPLFYLSTVLAKFFHEMGHGMICKRYGGQVHTFGVMLMIFVPLPYLDVTSSWAFRHRYQRVLVGMGGMLSEFFIAGIAAMIWANTGEGLLNLAAFQVMFIASVSTLLFNLNPLLRFDGYYIFSDLMDLPNLYQRSRRQLTHLGERYLFGVKSSFSPAIDRRERFWLTSYGIASMIYRVFLLAGVTFLLAESFFGLGLALASFSLVLYFGMPLAKFLKYLFTSPRLQRNRRRALAVSGLLFGLLGLFLWFYPFPNHFSAPGVVMAKQHTRLYAETEGYLAELALRSGDPVRKGQVIARIENPELRLQFESAIARRRQLAEQLNDARQRGASTLIEPLRAEQATVAFILRELRFRQEQQTIRAPHDGVWSYPTASEQLGSWLQRGSQFGEVINTHEFQFLAVVPQEQSANLFSDQLRGAEVRLRGDAGKVIPVTAYQIIPAQQYRLPTSALSRLTGGELATRSDDPSATRTVQGFYQVRANLAAADDAALYHLRRGRIRFDLPPLPLLQQGLHELLQLLQRRLKL